MPRLYRVLVPVKNIDDAEHFYGNVLQMPGERVSPGRHYFDCEGTILACFDPQADGDGFPPKPRPEEIYIAVTDLEAIYERCQTFHAEFSSQLNDGQALGEIHYRPWGERSFYVKDPFGNHLCFVDKETVFTTAE